MKFSSNRESTVMNRKHLSFFLLFVLLSIACVSIAAQPKVLTPEAILTIRTIMDVQLAPDGKNIMFQLNRPRTETERPGGTIAEIWTMSATGGEPRRFTFNERGDRTPQWSPDGKWIAFLSSRGESSVTQVYLVAFDGGEAVQLTKAEKSVGAFKWSRDGGRIAYTMEDAKTKDELAAEREGKDWTVVDRNYKHTHLYTIDVKWKVVTLVTKSDLTIHDFDWAPDGKQFVVAAAETPTVDDSYMRKRIMKVSSDGGSPAAVVKTVGKLDNVRWSPDGKWIAWLGAIAENDPYQGSVFVVPSGGGNGENLTQGYQGTANWLGWMPGKPSTIVFRAIERQATVLHTFDLPEKKRSPLMTQALIIGEPSFSKDGKSMALSANTPQHPNEIFVGASMNTPLNKLTTMNPQLAGITLGEQRVVKWKSTDGWEIEGVVVLPVGYQKGKAYPTVLQAHGGPEAADLNGWLGSYSRWGQMLAGMGYVTLYPNYRGSLGKGPAFSMADHKDLMGKEFEDMVAGIDYLIKEGITDPNRVGVGGGSYGGYTTGWAVTYASQRFKAGVMWMGISNWISMTGTSDIFYENSTVHWDMMMYDDNNYDMYWKRSPLAHIKNANTPTLIMHGAADPRVPIGQSYEMYTALKWKGVSTEFVVYPRAGHGLSEKAHQYDSMKRVAGWFEKYLK